MTLEEQGAYMRLLCHEWDTGPLPDDLVALARLLGVSRAVFGRLWRSLEPRFPLNGEGRRANPRIELVRQKMQTFRAGQVVSGKHGADKRWGDRPAHPEPTETERASPSDVDRLGHGGMMALQSPVSVSTSERQHLESLRTPVPRRQRKAVLAHTGTPTTPPPDPGWGMDRPPEMPGIDRHRQDGQGMQPIAAVLHRVTPRTA